LVVSLSLRRLFFFFIKTGIRKQDFLLSRKGENIMDQTKCILITVLLITMPLTLAVGGELMIYSSEGVEILSVPDSDPSNSIPVADPSKAPPDKWRKISEECIANCEDVKTTTLLEAYQERQREATQKCVNEYNACIPKCEAHKHPPMIQRGDVTLYCRSLCNNLKSTCIMNVNMANPPAIDLRILKK
jgi:hypothetical protein